MKNVKALAQKVLAKTGKVAKMDEPSTPSTDFSTAPPATSPPPPTPSSPASPPSPPVCPPGWPARLARLGVFPSTPEERKVPGWYERQKVKVRVALAAERERAVAAAGDRIPPPVPIVDLNETTMLEGMTLAEWDALDSNRAPGDLSEIPGWAAWGLRHWRERGKPTRQKKAKETYDELMEKANGALELALMKEKESQEQASEKQRLSLSKQAEKQRERHARLVAEAEVVAQQMKAAS